MAALQLLHLPASVRLMRESPLPLGVGELLQIAAGDKETIAAVEQTTGRDADKLMAAARFYIEQILWHPGADHFRLLGADPRASSAELKRNMALLMTWLHPDSRAPSAPYHAYVARITAAWNDLKTPDRRRDYEAMLARNAAEAAQRRRHFKARIKANRERINQARRSRATLWQRVWSMVVRRPDA